MADTLDVLTLTEGKSAVGLKSSGTNNDTLLAAYITAVSRRLDQTCGAIVTRSVTSERCDGGEAKIKLRHPVTTITSVTEYQVTTAVTLTAETVGTAPQNGYYSEPHGPDQTIGSGRLIRRASGFDYWFYPGRGNIVVTYTAGRYGTTATVDARFKEAAAIMLANLWGTQEPTTVTLNEFDTPGNRFPKFAIPNAVRHLLHDEWRELPGIGQ